MCWAVAICSLYLLSRLFKKRPYTLTNFRELNMWDQHLAQNMGYLQRSSAPRGSLPVTLLTVRREGALITHTQRPSLPPMDPVKNSDLTMV